MGRAYSSPKVAEAEGGFYITRTVNPDDEFASTEVMAYGWEGRDTEPSFVGWSDEQYVANRDVVMFSLRTGAEMALMFYRAGQENVTVRVVWE